MVHGRALRHHGALQKLATLLLLLLHLLLHLLLLNVLLPLLLLGAVLLHNHAVLPVELAQLIQVLLHARLLLGNAFQLEGILLRQLLASLGQLPLLGAQGLLGLAQLAHITLKSLLLRGQQRLLLRQPLLVRSHHGTRWWLLADAQ